MVNGIKNFNEDNLVKSFTRKDQLFDLLNQKFNHIQKTPTGVMMTPKDLSKEISISHNLSDNDLAFVLSLILLKDYGIITIPAVGMPGASATLRFDLSTTDAFNLDLNELSQKIISSFDRLVSVIPNEEECKKIVF
jgi:L-seryl-tRNA(Ser) seleniumtransferase